MSADRTSPALDPGHPLHSILSGFTEPPDEVFADDERSGGRAIVAPGPPRPLSAGRPRDDGPEGVAFTPPVPAGGLHDVIAEPDATRRGRGRRSAGFGVGAVLATLPPLPRPSRGLAAGLCVAGLAAAAVATSGTTDPQPARGGPAASARQGDGLSSVDVARSVRRRDRRPRGRRPRGSRGGPRSPAGRTRAPVREVRAAVVASSRGSAVATAGAASPSAGPSRFTSEFTP